MHILAEFQLRHFSAVLRILVGNQSQNDHIIVSCLLKYNPLSQFKNRIIRHLQRLQPVQSNVCFDNLQSNNFSSNDNFGICIYFLQSLDEVTRTLWKTNEI